MKVVVAHPEQQHSYRLATALKRITILEKYITTVYYKKRSWTKLVSYVLKGKFRTRAQGRNCFELSEHEVYQFCEVEGLLKLLAMYVPFLHKYYDCIRYHTADRFAKKVADYAIKNNVDIVVTYDDCSPILFEILKEKAPHIKRVLDVSAANRLFMREIYDTDTVKALDFANRLKKECSVVWNEKYIERTKRELENTQFFLSPSSFVDRSLQFSGISKNRIFYCPYGVDISMFTQKEYEKLEERQPLKFIYVGGVKELKGIYYLLEAFKQISKEKATLTIVGYVNKDDTDIQPYLEYVQFTGPLLHKEVAKELRKADVFVFPSLGDSYSLSVMEAAASGLPVIVSENTGVKDMVTDGVEGFIIPIQSIDAIVEKVNWFIDNSDKITEMGCAARRMAEHNTWDAYYDRVGDVFCHHLS